MKRVLVLGASGGMGYSIVKELSSRGIQVVAFARNEKKMTRLFGADDFVEVRVGDVFKEKDLKTAAQGIDVIFHAINLPYHQWQENLLVMNRNIISAVREASAKLAIVENIYAYGRGNGEKIDEEYPKEPHTRKGKIRLEVESFVKNSGVPYLIAHFPDFYGPHAENTYMNYMLRKVAVHKKAQFVGKQTVAREYIYTPDGAEAIVELAMRDDAYYQNWNIPGVYVITGKEIIKIVRDIAEYNKPVTTITKGMLWFVGLFDKQMQEALEMFYLNENPVVLNGEKYHSRIGNLPQTSYRQGLKDTLKSYQK
jgi:nucleoside-diphosphate-sugar epimerase